MIKFHFELPPNVSNAGDDQDQPTSRAEIYIETENGYFPCLGWSDRLLSVVMQWIGNVIQVVDAQPGEQNVSNYFMDGPYYFDLQKIEKDHVTIQFMKRTRKSEKIEEIPSLTIALIDYSNALFDLTKNLINDPDFQWLGKEKERAALRQSLSMLRTRL